ncbi:MAG: ABC-F family ATP-binding cassette domain-containing protein [Pseudonocardiaceae bacterium]
MANLVNLEAVSKSYGIRPLLSGVSLGVEAGDRIGVVGLNGGGKTTLLEVLAGLQAPDAGRVSRARGVRVAVLTQRTELPEHVSVRQAVLDPLGVTTEHEWAADPRVRAVLDGLGIPVLGLDRPVAGLSGGERRRVVLAATLVGELDLVMLDEPTNHLDVEGVAWLAEHLLARRCAVVVVTHDRWFLDTVCTRTWEVADGRVDGYDGGYADWVYARAERGRLAAVAEDRRRNLARKELAWLRRGPPARSSKPRYRIEAAEALIADVPAPRDNVELLAFARRRLGRIVLELEDVTVTIAGRRLLDTETWRIGPGERIGLVGVNGSGKTTLLRLLAGERKPDAGRRVQGQTVRLAHLHQELIAGSAGGELEHLPESLRVLEAVEEVARHVTLCPRESGPRESGRQELSASQLAERLGFPASRQWTPVADLSGGERRRLQLTRLLMAEPNVLLLDEPTNDLDIDTLQQLEDLLDGWPGSLVVVSHDRYFVDRVCDTVVALLGDGRVTHLPGGISEYLDRRDRAVSSSGDLTGSVAGAGKEAAELRVARKELARLERQLERLAGREAELQQQIIQRSADPAAFRELDGELRTVLAAKSELETRWLEVADATG